MAYSTKILPHYTFDDWKLWEGNWELLEGHPIAMSPHAVPRHQEVAASLMAEFHTALKACKTCTVYDTLDYKISEDTIVAPDVLIVCQTINKKYLDFPPTLVIEILSPSTALRDGHSKFEIYENQGIKYYLIIDAVNNEAENYELKDHRYMRVDGPDCIYLFEFDPEGSKARINFNEIW